AAATSDEDEGEDRPEQAVEHDGLGEREAEPLNALELATRLGLPGARLDHRREDEPDAAAGAGRAEADAHCEADRLPGFCDVAGGGGENGCDHVEPPSALAPSPSRCRWRTGRRR